MSVELVKGIELDDAEVIIYMFLAEKGSQEAAVIGTACYPLYTKKIGKDWYMVAGWEGWARRILLMLIQKGLVREHDGKFEVIRT